MDSLSILGVIRRRFRLVLAGILLATVVSLVVSLLVPKSYEARATLIVGQSLTALNPDYQQLLASQQLSSVYVEVATTRPVLSDAIAATDLHISPDDLAKQVTVQPGRDSSLITITVQDANPDRAARTANGIAQSLIKASPSIQGQSTDIVDALRRDLDATRREIESTQGRVDQLTSKSSRTPAEEARLEQLQSRMATLRSTYVSLVAFISNSAANLLSVVDPAVPPTDAASPRISANLALAALVGLLISVTVAFAVENLDDTVKNREDVETILGLPALGSIPTMSAGGRRSDVPAAALAGSFSPAAEAFTSLRTNLEFSSVDRRIEAILVTSATTGEGKSIVAANLAAAFAQAGRRTLLIDADLRRPAIAPIFGMTSQLGLTTLLRPDTTWPALLGVPTREPNLRILPAGMLPPNPAELLGSQRMRDVMAKSRQTSDLVIVDSPPLDHVIDAAVLASLVDGVLLVVRPGHSRGGEAKRALELLARGGANVLGVALNRERPSRRYSSRRSARGAHDDREDVVPSRAGPIGG